jgi:hypothetical protein
MTTVDTAATTTTTEAKTSTIARPRFNLQASLREPCILHSKAGWPMTHTTTDCHTTKEIERARQEKEGHDPDQDKDNKITPMNLDA